MAKKVSMSITFNRFPEIAKRVPELASEVVRKSAFDLEANAKSIVPVRTGRLKNSITTEMVNKFEAHIAPHTDYAEIVEYGGHNRAPRPYMRPSIEKVRPEFIDACKKILEELK